MARPARSTTTTARGWLRGPVLQDWEALARPTGHPGTFDPAGVDDLPAPVGRWLRRTIAPGAPLRRSVELTMHGEIRIGRWVPFVAAQVLSAGSGYVWAAEAGRWPLSIRGYDRFSDGTGEMRWRLLGLLPVMSARDADVTRSAAGRLAGETMLLPAAALDPALTWRPVDDLRATADVDAGGYVHHVTVTVDDEGRLRSVSLPRWGDPDRSGYAERSFVVDFDGEDTFDGYTVPIGVQAGWDSGSPGAAAGDGGVFFRATIDGANFR
jgi:hypothetical protein